MDVVIFTFYQVCIEHHRILYNLMLFTLFGVQIIHSNAKSLSNVSECY